MALDILRCCLCGNRYRALEDWYLTLLLVTYPLAFVDLIKDAFPIEGFYKRYASILLSLLRTSIISMLLCKWVFAKTQRDSYVVVSCLSNANKVTVYKKVPRTQASQVCR